jgi:hypothetical protein
MIAGYTDSTTGRWLVRGHEADQLPVDAQMVDTTDPRSAWMKVEVDETGKTDWLGSRNGLKIVPDREYEVTYPRSPFDQRFGWSSTTGLEELEQRMVESRTGHPQPWPGTTVVPPRWREGWR